MIFLIAGFSQKKLFVKEQKLLQIFDVNHKKM